MKRNLNDPSAKKDAKALAAKLLPTYPPLVQKALKHALSESGVPGCLIPPLFVYEVVRPLQLIHALLDAAPERKETLMALYIMERYTNIGSGPCGNYLPAKYGRVPLSAPEASFLCDEYNAELSQTVAEARIRSFDDRRYVPELNILDTARATATLQETDVCDDWSDVVKMKGDNATSRTVFCDRLSRQAEWLKEDFGRGETDGTHAQLENDAPRLLQALKDAIVSYADRVEKFTAALQESAGSKPQGLRPKL